MFYYPKSLTRLILVGLVLILLPLTFAFYNVASNLELLAGRGQRAVFEAVQITQDSRLLIQRITDLERIARQYMVVEDSKLLEGYFKLHEEVQNAAKNSIPGPWISEQRAKLKELMARGKPVIRYGQRYSDAAVQCGARRKFLHPTQRLGQSILTQSDQVIGREAEALSIASIAPGKFCCGNSSHLFHWRCCCGGVHFPHYPPVPPDLRRHTAIGDGKLNIPLVVTGPEDLVDLGKRLDWLRQRLFDLQEQKTKFFQHVSHELNTPLAALREGVRSWSMKWWKADAGTARDYRHTAT